MKMKCAIERRVCGCERAKDCPQFVATRQCSQRAWEKLRTSLVNEMADWTKTRPKKDVFMAYVKQLLKREEIELFGIDHVWGDSTFKESGTETWQLVSPMGMPIGSVLVVGGCHWIVEFAYLS